VKVKAAWPSAVAFLLWLALLDFLLPGAIRAYHGRPPVLMWLPLFGSMAVSALVAVIAWAVLDRWAERRQLRASCREEWGQGFRDGAAGKVGKLPVHLWCEYNAGWFEGKKKSAK